MVSTSVVRGTYYNYVLIFEVMGFYLEIFADCRSYESVNIGRSGESIKLGRLTKVVEMSTDPLVNSCNRLSLRVVRLVLKDFPESFILRGSEHPLISTCTTLQLYIISDVFTAIPFFMTAELWCVFFIGFCIFKIISRRMTKSDRIQ